MAETRTINLEIKDNVKSLKTQYREAIQEVQTLADTYGATSREAAEAAKRAAELKDRIEESKSLTDAFNPDAKFNALSGSIGGVLNGFQAYEGAMGLIGVESEALQETLLKVQSAMALSQGIQGALEAKDAFVNLGAVVKDAFGKMSTAGKLFAVTGVGLIITAVGALVANMDKLKEKFTGVTEVTKSHNEAVKEGAKAMAEATMTVNEVGLAFEQAKKGVISKEQALKTYNDKLGATLGTTDDLNEAEKIYRENSGKYIKAVQARAIAQALAQKAAEKLAEAETAAMENNLKAADYAEIGLKAYASSIPGAGLLFGSYQDQADQAAERNRQRIKETQDRAKQAFSQLNDLSETYLKDALSIESQLASGKAKVEEKVRKKEKTTVKERVDYARQLEKEKIDAMEDGMEKRIKLLQFELAGELAGIDKKGKKAGELRKAIEARYAKEIEKVKEEYAPRKLDEKQQKEQDDFLAEAANRRKNFKITTEVATNEELLTIQQDLINKQKALDEAAAAAAKAKLIERTDLVLKYAKTFTDVYSSLNGLLNASDNERLKKVQKGSKEEEKIKKRMFNRDKALRISQTVVDTASNIVTSVRNGGGIPTGIPFGIAAGAMGALQIAAISKTKFDGGESGGGGNSAPDATAGTNVSAPQFNTIGSSGINQLAQLQQQPVQAYVVSGEVTSAQALDRNRIQNATL